MRSLRFLLLVPAFLFAETSLKLGPMLGHVGSDEARVWGQAEGACTLGLRLSSGDVSGPALVEKSAYMGAVRATGLTPDTEYDYTVLLDGKPLPNGPHGHFRTAPAPGAPTKLRVAFSSCYGRNGALSAPARLHLAAMTDIDLMLQLGDNHYADTTSPAGQRAKYFSQRNTKEWHASVSSLSTYAIWDDHDYGPNDSDRTAVGKEHSLQTFREHWANPSYGEPDNPGIYSTFRRGDIQFFLLDDRYYRDPKKAPDDPPKTVLGRRQKAWVKRELTRSKAKLKLVALGSEWQLHGHSDSYTSFKTEQKEMLDFFKDIEGVILLSGDRHFTGAYQIRGETIEVTAGPMGAQNFPTKNLPDMFINHGKGLLIGVLDLDTTVTPPKVKIEVHRAREGLVESREISWDELNGKKRIEPLAP